MSQRLAAARFEAELLRLAPRIHKLKGEPALASVAAFSSLLGALLDPDARTSGAAASRLRELHRAYEYVRLHDDNFRPLTEGKKRKVTVRLKDEYLPQGTDPDLVRAVWPLLPFISFFYTRAHTSAWTPEMLSARLFEYVFVLLCTQPRAMRPFLHDLALEAIEAKSRALGARDPVALANIVMERLEARPLPVARYRARAATVEEAASNVCVYMFAAICRRLRDALVTSGELDVAPSTARRWRAAGRDVSSASAVRAIRAETRANQSHVPEGRFSVASIARVTGRSRTTVKLKVTEMEHSQGIAVERGADNTFWLSRSQAQFVIRALKQAKTQARPKRPDVRTAK